MLTPHCVECGEPLDKKSTGRPRLYCSNRCRLRAQRRRKSEPAYRVIDAGAADVGELDVSDVLGPTSADPDEAVVESIVLARSAAASFGVSAERARPQLSWRCEKMAEHIAAGLTRYFKPR